MKRIRLLTVTLLSLCAPIVASAQVPQIINYQGRVSVGGTNFTGTGEFKFALVNGPPGTTTYWSNGVATVSLPVTNGLYAVLLGDTTIPNMTAPISAAVFTNSDVRLRVWFGTTIPTVQQLSPDQRIAAVGYALTVANVLAVGRNTFVGENAGNSTMSGSNNTASGFSALSANTTGYRNTAIGQGALKYNTNGYANTASGGYALLSNTSGSLNTANGDYALFNNTNGNNNTACGADALMWNTEGWNNTANGMMALLANTRGMNNTAIGALALDNNTTGSSNIALGCYAGDNLTTGNNNIDIGNPGVAGESRRIRIGVQGTQTNTYIAGIWGTPANVSDAAVYVNSSGRLGVPESSARFKEAIQSMGRASEVILALRPVTFRHRSDTDPDSPRRFGLIAEEVEQVAPELVVRDAQGQIYTVRYDAVNAMLLNEFLKQHCRVQDLEQRLNELERRLEPEAK